MNRVFYPSHSSALEAYAERLTYRSAVVLCDAKVLSEQELRMVHKWICETPDKPPKYVCFVGRYSGDSHDAYDDLDVALNRDALTTWHDDEIIEDIVYFVSETVGWAEKGPHTQIVVGTAYTSFEREFIERLKV